MARLARAKPWETTVAAGAALIVFPLGGFLALMKMGTAWYVQLIYPLPLLTVLPYMFLSYPLNLGLAAWLIPSVVFWAWGFHLYRGNAKVPLRSEILFWLLAVLTVVYFSISWQYGARWQGYLHLLGVAVLNLAAILVLWRLLVRAKAAPSFGRNITFHWSLVAWLGWFAFPWLGEGI